MEIGFIGIGVMGKSIVRHILNGGHTVYVYTRTKEKAQSVLESGAIWCDSPARVAERSDIIFTMVGYPSDVEEVYYGKRGIFETAKEGSVVVDLTTSTPSLAKRLYETAQQLRLQSLDAPVSGGDIGAQQATLTIMVGGDEEAFEQVKPVFQLFGKTVIRQGEAGAGQHTKMANQIMIAGTMTGLTELLVYARAAGLNVEKVLQTVGGGSARNWSLENYGPRILREDYSPGFFAKHFLKDLNIALEEADKLNLRLPATQQARELYEQLCAQGKGDLGTQALIQLWWKN